MMDPLSGLNRGYAFVTFCTKEAAQEAVKLVRSPDGAGESGKGLVDPDVGGPAGLTVLVLSSTV